MIFDYRPLITLDPAEAQLNEGGANQWENCGPATYALILKWLGNGDLLEPQQITDAIHGVNYHGGEVSAKLIAFFEAHRDKYPHLPTITVEQGGDVVGKARAAALQDYPTCNWWFSNSNGDIQPRNTGILHWSAIVYDDGANLGIFNIMRGQVVALPYATARAAYAGEFTTFHQSLEVDILQLSTKMAFVRMAFVAGHGAEPPDMNALTTWANAIADDGHNTSDIVAQIMDAPDGIAWRSRLAALVTGTASTAAFAVKDHAHVVTGSAK